MSKAPIQIAADEFWAEFVQNIRVMHFIGDISEKTRTSTQQNQYQQAQDYVRMNFEEGTQIMGRRLFGEMSLEFDEDSPGQFLWLSEILNDNNNRPPTFPNVFTPEVVQVLITKIYSAQTTIASTLEEIEPAYNKWLDYEKRVKLMYKGACGLDKEWTTEALSTLSHPEDMYILARRLGQHVSAFKIRLDQLTRAYEAVSRLITVMEMNPTAMLTRYEPEDAPTPQKKGFYSGKRASGFGRKTE